MPFGKELQFLNSPLLIDFLLYTKRLGKLPKGFRDVASTENSGFAGIVDEKRRFYGIQFHPEVTHTDNGQKMLDNFIFNLPHHNV